MRHLAPATAARVLAAAAAVLILAIPGCRTPSAPEPAIPRPEPVPEKPEAGETPEAQDEAGVDVRVMPLTVLAVRPLEGAFHPSLAGALEEGRVSGWKPAGPPMILGLAGGPLEVALQLAEAPTVQPPWRLLELPETRVAVQAVRGGYEHLAAEQAGFRERVEAAGYTLSGPTGAVLLDDPGSVAAGDLRARLFVPIR